MAEREAERPYKLTVEGAGMSFDRAVTEEIALRVISLVMGGGSLPLAQGAVDNRKEVSGSVTASRGGEPPAPRAFMAEKRPNSDTERITCLAYYLTNYRGTASFKTGDLTALNTEAAQPRFSNASVAARNAVTYQYLSLAGSGRKQIAVRGEALVEALPDREKVKVALTETPARKRRVAKRPATRGAGKRTSK